MAASRRVSGADRAGRRRGSGVAGGDSSSRDAERGDGVERERRRCGDRGPDGTVVRPVPPVAPVATTHIAVHDALNAIQRRADKWRLLMQDRQSGKMRDLTEKFDRAVGSFTWFGDSAVLFSAEDHGAAPVFAALPFRRHGPEIIPLKEPGWSEIHADDLVWVNDTLFFTRMSIGAPNEIWKHADLAADGPIYNKRIRALNRSRT